MSRLLPLLLAVALLPPELLADDKPKTPLEKEQKLLATRYQELDSYFATYKIRAQDGRTGICELGRHRESGWTLFKTELKNEDGEIARIGQSWVTGEGTFILSVEGQTMVYNNFKKFANQANVLLLALASTGDSQPLPMEPIPFALLSRDRLDASISFAPGGPRWLQEPEILVEKNETTTTFDWEGYGQVIIDRSNGLIRSQIYKTPTGERSIILTDLKTNLAKDFFEKRFEVPLKKAVALDFSQSGMGEQVITRIFQALITTFAEQGISPLNLQQWLSLRENDVVTFLHLLPLEKGQIFAEDSMIEFLELGFQNQFKGQDITFAEALAHRNFIKKFFPGLGKKYRPRQGPSSKQGDYVRNVVFANICGQRLQSTNDDEKVVKEIIEDFLVDVYLRTKFEKAARSHLEILQKK